MIIGLICAFTSWFWRCVDYCIIKAYLGSALDFNASIDRVPHLESKNNSLFKKWAKWEKRFAERGRRPLKRIFRENILLGSPLDSENALTMKRHRCNAAKDEKAVDLPRKNKMIDKLKEGFFSKKKQEKELLPTIDLEDRCEELKKPGKRRHYGFQEKVYHEDLSNLIQ